MPDLLPIRYDWKGNPRPRSVFDLTKKYSHLPSTFLYDLLEKHIKNTDTLISPPTAGLNTVLGEDEGSVMREHSVHDQEWRSNEKRRKQHRWRHFPGLAKTGSSVNIFTRQIENLPRITTEPSRYLHSQYTELVSMQGHKYPVYCVLFDRAGLRVITGSDDYLVKVWCSRTGYLIYTLRGHLDVITDLAINPGNTMLATASQDGVVRIWALANGEPIAVLRGNTGSGRKAFTNVVFSPSPIPENRYLLATSDDGYSRIWKWDCEKNVFDPNPYIIDCKTLARDEARCCSFNKTGTQFAVAGTDGFVRVISTIHPSENGMSTMSEEESSNLISSFQSRFPILAEPRLTAQLDGHQGCVTTLFYSHSGKQILSGSIDGTARIWSYNPTQNSWSSIVLDVRDDLKDGDQSDTLTTQTGDQTGTAVLAPLPQPTSQLIPPNGIERSEELLHQEPNSTSTSNNNASVSAGLEAAAENSTSNLLQEPSTDSHIPRGRSRAAHHKKNKVAMVNWSLNDAYAIVSGTDGAIRVFDSRNGELIHTLRKHTAEVYALATHTIDSRILLSAGYDGQIIIWDIFTGNQLNSFSYPERQFLDIRMLEDGLLFAVTDHQGMCLLFGAGQPTEPYKHVRQFKEQMFWSDYLPIRLDANYFVVDEQTQLAPHLMERSSIFDFDGREYVHQKGVKYGFDFPVGLPPEELEHERQVKLALLADEVKQLTPTQTSCLIPETLDKKQLYKRRSKMIRDSDDDDIDPMTIDIPIIPLPDDDDDEEYTEEEAEVESESDGSVDCAVVREDFPERNDDGLRDFVVKDDEEEDDDEEEEEVSSRIQTRRSALKAKKRRARSARKKEKRKTSSKANDVGKRTTRSKHVSYQEPNSSDFESEDLSQSEDSDDLDESFSNDPGEGSSKVEMGASTSKPEENGGSKRKKKLVKKSASDTGHAVKYVRSDWISTTRPSVSPYIPQIGDVVAYVIPGHKEYLEHTSLLEKLHEKEYPWVTNPELSAVTFGTIANIDYWVGPPTWCTLTLDVLDSGEYTAPFVPASTNLSSTENTIKIEYHNISTIPDFIVLLSQYKHGMEQNLQVGDEVLTIYNDKQASGIVSMKTNADEENPNSPWRCFAVKWDTANDSVQTYSPWELYRSNYPQELDEIDRLPSDEAAHLRKAIEYILSKPESEPFREHVNFKQYPAYLQLIPYPMCFEMVLDRVTHDFYRRSEAVLFDVALISSNAATFNQANAPITKLAKQLVDEYKQLSTESTIPSPIKATSKRRARVARYSDDDSEDEYHDEDEDEEFADQDLPEEVDFQDEEGLEDDDDAEEEIPITRNKRKLITRQKGRKKQRSNGQTPTRRKKRNPIMSDSDDEYQETSPNLRQRGDERRNTRSSRGQASNSQQAGPQDFEFDSINPHDEQGEATPRRTRRGRAFVVEDED